MKKHFFSLLMVLTMCLSMLFTSVFAVDAAEMSWNHSKSKTATNLDENFVSKVTLSNGEYISIVKISFESFIVLRCIIQICIVIEYGFKFSEKILNIFILSIPSAS